MKKRILVFITAISFVWLFIALGMPKIVKEILWNRYCHWLYSEYLPLANKLPSYKELEGDYIMESEGKESQKQYVRLQTLQLAEELLEQDQSLEGEESEPEITEEIELPTPISMFVPGDKVETIEDSVLSDYTELVKQFYTIDKTTAAGESLLNVEEFHKWDLSMEKNSAEPQILIYHTHTRERYSDSDGRDTGVVGAGERLAEILRTDYGYQVLHCSDSFDEPDYTKAYSTALTAVQSILEENPSIQVIIDLHRDDLPENYDNTETIQGMECARFMFFNGLCRTKKTGELSYLKNENLGGNLAFSFALEKKAKEYYPGLTRKIYLKSYRYNMHLRPRSILLELGCQHNTYEEACNSCYPIAHILDMVLQGG